MYKIAHIENNFTEKFGVPRQSGLVGEIRGKIVFEPEFRNADALRGLEAFSHIWLIWEFSNAKRRGVDVPENSGKGGTDSESRTGSAGETGEACEWRPTVRPPRLGGNIRMGVFATRSPFRPNPVGLSCVELEKIDYNAPEGPVLIVKGADLMNGTPIFDIKPYLPYADCKPEATGGFTDVTEKRRLRVELPDNVKKMLKPNEAGELIGILEQDPRPAYQDDADRVYTFSYGRYEVSFRAADGTAKDISIRRNGE